MTETKRTIKQKLFLGMMMLAFAWVITGDLVSIHLKVIFGDKVDSGWHHPLAKTHKDDSNTYKVKSHKSDGSSKSSLYAFIGNSNFQISVSSSSYSFLHTLNLIVDCYHQQNPPQRGPPSLV